MSFDTSHLYSTVRNLTGADRVFGYIPPHGKRLRIQQAYTVPGNIIDRISMMGGVRNGWNQVRFRSLERDLKLGRLAIEKTPPPIFYDSAPSVSLANPTVALTTSGVGTGPTWTGPTGSYTFWYTWTTAAGETAAVPTGSAPLTLTNGTSKLQVTLPALPTGPPAATATNVYISAPGGGISTAQLLFSTTATGAVQGPAAAGGAAPPSTNTAVLPAPRLQPGVNPTGGGATGGVLPAGTYYLVYTHTNANGETPASPESLQFTVAAGNVPSVTISPLPQGVTGINIYLSPTNGAPASEVYYVSVPTFAGGVPSNLTGYLKPGTATNPFNANSIYLLDTPLITGAAAVNPPGGNTALINPPTVQPVAQVVGATSTLIPPSNMTGYLVPGLYNDMALMGFAQGGSMAVGNYYMKYTYTTAAGETTPSPESPIFTVSQAGQIPLALLVPSLRQLMSGPGYNPPGALFPEGVTGVNVYVTPVNGAAGSETLYLAGLTSGMVRLMTQSGGAGPPTANTTYGRTIRTLRVSGDTLGTIDPSWGGYSGAA